MDTPRISLKDVADAVGLTRMTVSLALRGHPSIPLQTRALIKEKAKEMGYRPDPEVARVMSQIRARRRNHQPTNIAYITSHGERDKWREYPTQLAYYEGALKKAEELGYRLEEFWLAEKGMSAKRLGSIIRARGISGVIIAPLPKRPPAFDEFPWSFFSPVALGYSLADPRIYRACNHQFQSMRLLVGQLRRRGYQRIGFAMEKNQDDRVRHNWRGGFMADQATVSRPPFLLRSDWTLKAFARWLEAEKPDVVITAGPEVERWLAMLGLKTPADIGLANVDLSAEMKMRGVTGIEQNSHLVGAAGLDLLALLMSSHNRGLPDIPTILMVEGTFSQGSTTRSHLKR